MRPSSSSACRSASWQAAGILRHRLGRRPRGPRHRPRHSPPPRPPPPSGHDDAYHIHARLGIVVGDGVIPPPADIGVGTTCLYWVHTHAADGVIHVEAPANVSPTLGDFFAIWALTYPGASLLARFETDLTAAEIHVDERPFVGDGRALPLADGKLIQLIEH